mmetsp:Transcript_55999/g.133427  ORF Transcript_55999/g.133427 Transcript_55999/m.133427 type:complete len:406 (+) Transcript_55999:122-1339(+)|eukprot:CAMPEP_0178382266 /NCGR_PEP_ID=MMETSP0689_2-20121128/6405_1 /TAXON_ID=160604 /ORGANISM="Amphidinium massartii, Strain CS-259" /LENGTH=405 /DNA_ID=CAMNT_0020002465 /DNA_START=54 /DNA_END=1271 /DNA_ORIENTATION=+
MCENCATVCGLGCLCCVRFGCSVEKTRAALSFVPPTPPSYRVESKDNGKTNKVAFSLPAINEAPLYQAAAAVAEVHWLKPRKGSKIPIVWIRHSAVLQAFGGAKASSSSQSRPSEQQGSRLVLLHCHGNATDLGMMMGPYLELSRLLCVDVVGVEYSGYGASSADLHTAHLLSDLETAYKFLLEQGIPATKIVAYGQSIGSSPVTRLASKYQLGGLILHSPLASGLKVVEREGQSNCCRPSCAIYCFDVFTNDRYVQKVKCLVFIMHGESDEVVPLHNAELLYNKCRPSSRWPAYFKGGAGHNNLIEADVKGYYCRMAGFLSEVEKLTVGASSAALVTPTQEQMAEMVTSAYKDGRSQDGKGKDMTPFPEPIVGPQDGRYEQLRRGEMPGSASNVRSRTDPSNSS